MPPHKTQNAPHENGWGAFVLKYAFLSTAGDWIICGVILAIIAFCCILIPENIIKKKDNDYFFKSNGYYDRYKN